METYLYILVGIIVVGKFIIKSGLNTSKSSKKIGSYIKECKFCKQEQPHTVSQFFRHITKHTTEISKYEAYKQSSCDICGNYKTISTDDKTTLGKCWMPDTPLQELADEIGYRFNKKPHPPINNETINALIKRILKIKLNPRLVGCSRKTALIGFILGIAAGIAYYSYWQTTVTPPKDVGAFDDSELYEMELFIKKILFPFIFSIIGYLLAFFGAVFKNNATAKTNELYRSLFNLNLTKSSASMAAPKNNRKIMKLINSL